MFLTPQVFGVTQGIQPPRRLEVERGGFSWGGAVPPAAVCGGLASGAPSLTDTQCGGPAVKHLLPALFACARPQGAVLYHGVTATRVYRRA